MNKLIYLITVFSVLIVSCNKNADPAGQAPPAVSVKTTTVSKSSAVFFDKYPGTVNALQKVDLRSEVSGYIKNITFEEGEEVKKGQPLYTIDQSKYQAAKNQALAQLKVAQANQNQAQLDADRYIALGKKDAIATQQVDMAKTSLENSKQQVAAAKADLETAQTNLNYSVIKAPFNGIIGISEVRLGTYLVQGVTLLNTISSFDPIGVDFEINEKEISRLVDLKNNKNILQDSSIYLLLPDKSKYPFPGTVKIIDRGINSQTGTVTVRLSFNNPNEGLRDGMSVQVNVKNTASGTNIIIPHKAVAEQMGEFFVFAVNDGKAKQLKVETGPNLGDRIVITKGLKEGQTIVVEGIQSLRDGMAVQTGAAPNKQTGKTPAANAKK